MDKHFAVCFFVLVYCLSSSTAKTKGPINYSEMTTEFNNWLNTISYNKALTLADEFIVKLNTTLSRAEELKQQKTSNIFHYYLYTVYIAKSVYELATASDAFTKMIAADLDKSFAPSLRNQNN